MPHRTLLALVRLENKIARPQRIVYGNVPSRSARLPQRLRRPWPPSGADAKWNREKRAEQIKIDNLLPEERELVESIK